MAYFAEGRETEVSHHSMSQSCDHSQWWASRICGSSINTIPQGGEEREGTKQLYRMHGEKCPIRKTCREEEQLNELMEGMKERANEEV